MALGRNLNHFFPYIINYSSIIYPIKKVEIHPFKPVLKSHLYYAEFLNRLCKVLCGALLFLFICSVLYTVIFYYCDVILSG